MRGWFKVLSSRFKGRLFVRRWDVEANIRWRVDALRQRVPSSRFKVQQPPSIPPKEEKTVMKGWFKVQSSRFKGRWLVGVCTTDDNTQWNYSFNRCICVQNFWFITFFIHYSCHFININYLCGKVSMKMAEHDSIKSVLLEQLKQEHCFWSYNEDSIHRISDDILIESCL